MTVAFICHGAWMFIILLQNHKNFEPKALQLCQVDLVLKVMASCEGSEFFFFSLRFLSRHLKQDDRNLRTADLD